MNALRHHPDDATLVSYAACGLERNFALVLNLHLRECPRCQQRITEAERVGSALFQNLPEAEVDSDCKAALMALLESTPAQPAESVNDEADEPTLPAPLDDWKRADFDALPWKRMAPGIRRISIPVDEGRLNLLRIAPGTCLPAHSHSGNELTLVLRGSFSDEVGRFTPGNIADLDDEVEHQPIADRNEDCICLVATDGPLRFRDWLPQLLQPLFRL